MSHLEGAYEQVNMRLAAIDLRFDGVDRRFDSIDRRFDSVDRKIDERFMWTIGIMLTCWFTTMLGIIGLLVKHQRVKYALLYDSADDVLEKAPLHGAAHRAWWKQFLEDGTLLMIGPFANPKDGAMAVFKTREAAEAFAAGDPFVLNGVVKSWRIAEWLEAIGN